MHDVFITSLKSRISYHTKEVSKFDDPDYTMSNLIINGMLSFAIAALSSVFFFENNGYGQRGRWVFILAAVIIGMFALSPIRQAWSRWRIRSLQAKIDRLKE